MNRRQKIIVSITGIFLVLLILVGLTYAYFLTRIKGNDNEKSISVTTANLELTYGDGTNKILTTTESIIPSNDPIGTKDFTVTNNGNATVNNYAVYLEDIENKLTRTSDLVYTLTCTSSVQNKTCNGKSETVYPNKNGILVTNSIDKDEVQTYVLTLTYKEMNEDQSEDMNKTINGKIQIYNLKDIVDIEGTVTNALATDYVQINSVEKKSQIINGEYKLPAVEPGVHTIRVFDKDGVEKSSRQITIKKGKTTSVSGNTITITDDSQTISMTLNRTTTSSDSISNTIIDYNPFEKGTLAYNILTNAKNKINGTELKENLSTVGMTTDGTKKNDRYLSTAVDDYGTTYYFRGNVLNNYVKFAEMCWQIVRIQGDGSIKMIMNSETTNCYSQTLATDGARGKKGSYIVTNYGYKTDSSNNIHLDYINSSDSARIKLNTWLNTKLNTTEQNLLKNDRWCVGISLKSNIPSYKCRTSGITGGTDTNKIGMLTMDELIYAGMKEYSWEELQNLDHLDYYNYIQDPGSSSSFGNWYIFAASNDFPYGFNSDGGTIIDFAAFVSNLGVIRHDTNVTDLSTGWCDVGLRPVVSLLPNVQYNSGDGTVSNPYIIK